MLPGIKSGTVFYFLSYLGKIQRFFSKWTLLEQEQMLKKVLEQVEPFYQIFTRAPPLFIPHLSNIKGPKFRNVFDNGDWIFLQIIQNFNLLATSGTNYTAFIFLII